MGAIVIAVAVLKATCTSTLPEPEPSPAAYETTLPSDSSSMMSSTMSATATSSSMMPSSIVSSTTSASATSSDGGVNMSSTTAMQAGTEKQYSGEAILGVTNATAFLSDTPAQTAVNEGIAEHAGVATSHVDATFTEIVARRLYDESRRLQGDQVQVEFTITLPATLSSSDQAAAINSITSMTQSELQSTVQSKLAAANITAYNITVASFTAATEVTTSTSASTSAGPSGDITSLGFQIRIGLPLLISCTLSFAWMLNM